MSWLKYKEVAEINRSMGFPSNIYISNDSTHEIKTNKKKNIHGEA